MFGLKWKLSRRTPPDGTTTSIPPPELAPMPGAGLVMKEVLGFKVAVSIKSAAATFSAGIPYLTANPGVKGCSIAQN